MQKIELKTRFKIGDSVGEIEGGKRVGIVQNIFSKLTKVDSLNFLYSISYSVKPEKTYSPFRAAEESLGEIVYDEDGNAHLLKDV